MIDNSADISPAPDAPMGSTGRFQIMGSRTAALTQAQGRVVVLSLFFTVIYLIYAIRAFDLMVLQGTLAGFRDQLGLNQTMTATIATPRRDIVDRNGILLATSIKTASLYADPHTIIDPEGTAKGLAAIFPDQSAGDILQKLQSNKRFVWIKRNLTPTEQAAVLELGQPGLSFQEEYRRLYPQGPLAAHMVGYSGVDAKGLAGIEQSFNTMLAKDGDPLKLTLDVRLQHILRREITKTMDDFTASGGAGLIMDIRTGDVLAAVSLPDFDPHLAGTARETEKFNRVTLGTYELGSCFKIFTTAALLEQQNPNLNTTYDTREPIKVGRFTISDYHPENRVQTIPEVFMHSSNIGTAMMAQQIGTDGLKSFFDQLGLFDPAVFDIPEIGKPLVPRPWRDVSTLTTSYGHGIAITPLQLAAATATIIGDGTKVQPHLVARDPSKYTAPVERVVSEDTVKRMRQLMRLVVTHGTGTKANVPGMLVGGKTGTAEKSINGKYIHNALLSSFVGAFPMNDPKYIVTVTIDDPHPSKFSYGFATAGWTAAPAVGRVVAGMSNVLALAPDTTTPDPSDPLLPYLADFKDQGTETTKIIGGTKVAARVAVP